MSQSGIGGSGGISRRGLLQAGLSFGVAGALSSLAGCSSASSAGGSTTGGSSSSSNSSTPLKFPFLTDKSLDPAYQALGTAYAAQPGGQKVQLEVVPGAWQELVTRINSERQTNQPPDLSLITVSLIPGMIAKGQIVDLAPYIGKGFDLKKYSSASVATYTQGSSQWAIPANQYTQVLYYNKTLLDKAGIKEPPASWDTPWSFEEWRAAAEATTKSDGSVYGTVVEITPERTCQYLWSNGAAFLSDDASTYLMDSPQAKDTYTFLAKLFADKLVPPQSTLKTLSPSDLFVAGRAATMLDGAWDMAKVAAVKDFEWGVAPAPAGTTKKAYTPVWVDGWIIPKGSKQTDAAWKAIEFFSNDASWNSLVKSNVGGIPPLTSAVDANKTTLFSGLTDARKQVWFQSIDHSKHYGFCANYAQVLNLTLQQLSLVTTGNLGVSAALDGLKAPIQSLLDQNKK